MTSNQDRLRPFHPTPTSPKGQRRVCYKYIDVCFGKGKDCTKNDYHGGWEKQMAWISYKFGHLEN